jgi:hypothetical protein
MGRVEGGSGEKEQKAERKWEAEVRSILSAGNLNRYLKSSPLAEQQVREI